jgi:hypothetical protein
MPKKKILQWEVRQLHDGRWGIFLQQQFCRTDKPVCYAASLTEKSARDTVTRMNEESKNENE